jgi:hypothetical protein
MKNEIKLVQVPKIQHNIIETGKEIQKYIEQLNIENQVVTEDTIQALKTIHSDLNKIETVCEDNRKAVKKGCLSPYDELMESYKSQITEPLTKAKKSAKDKIQTFENTLKDEKKKELEIYFVELCADQSVDFLKFEDAKLNINITNTVTKLKKESNTFVLKVADDLVLIASQEYSIEILVEYKKTLNSSKAITDVLTRKEAEKQAKIQAEQKQWDRKVSELRNISMTYNSVTKTFDYNELIFVKESEIKELSKDKFTACIAGFKGRIEEYIEANKPKIEAPTESTVKIQVLKKPAAPIQKPVEQLEKEEILESEFRVKTTMAKLRLLATFLDENEIEYESL